MIYIRNYEYSIYSIVAYSARSFFQLNAYNLNVTITKYVCDVHLSPSSTDSTLNDKGHIPPTHLPSDFTMHDVNCFNNEFSYVLSGQNFQRAYGLN